MKILNISLLLILSHFLSNSLFAREFSIKISDEVLKALDISPELRKKISGGDLIGNGGGFAEQEFRFAYKRLPSIVKGCLETAFCVLSEDDKSLLERIGEISLISRDNKDGLIFLSEKMYPGFFKDSMDAEVRIAKTVPLKGAPIFINLDLIYNGDRSNLEFSSMVGILVHELGHQAGVRSHSYLDKLGSDLRFYLSKDFTRLKREFGGHEIEMTIINFEDANKSSEIFLLGSLVDQSEGSIKAQSYRGEIVNKLRCSDEKSFPIGYKITNAHWDRSREVNPGLYLLPFRSWIKIYCEDPGTVAIKAEEGDLEIDLYFIKGSLYRYTGVKLSLH